MTDTPTSTAEITSSDPLAVVPAADAPATDGKVVLRVVTGLILTILSVLVAEVAVFVITGSHLPDLVLGMGVTALGSLGTLLASTRAVPVPRRGSGG